MYICEVESKRQLITLLKNLYCKGLRPRTLGVFALNNMAEDKKGFVLYADQKLIFDDLTNDEAGILIKHIFSYVNDENPELEDRFLAMAFKPIKLQLKRDLVKYEVVKERNAANARKRWDAVALSGTQSHTKNADKGNDKGIDNDKGNGKVKDKDIINNWFIEFENGIEITEIARLNNLSIDAVKIKVNEFRNKAELTYPNYGKFVSHFKNWLNKNKSNSQKASNGMVY